MQKKIRILVLFLVAMLMTVSFAACGKKERNTKKSKEQIPDTNLNGEESEGQGSLNKYDTEALPIVISFPEKAVVSDCDGAILAEAPEYVLYVFATDTCDGGIVYDEMDIASILNSAAKEAVVQDTLRLKKYTMSQNPDAEIYNNINSMGGFWCKLSDMELEIKEKGTYSGDGFVMVYGMKETHVGVYVVLGILKNADYDDFSDADENRLTMLKSCALSLELKNVSEEDYAILNDTTPDGTEFRIVYKKDAFADIVKTNAGLCLFYGDTKTSYFLVQHLSSQKKCSAQEYLQTLISGVEIEGAVFSEMEELRGKMVYQKVTMTYPYDDAEIQEVVCVSVDEKGSVWLVDLCGTKQDVKAQEGNLLTLLWSLEEE